MNKKLTYISLFSAAGVGCYGFKLNEFECIATNELLEKRLDIQKHNNKCRYDSGYVNGDITKNETKHKILNEISMWKNRHGIDGPDVLIATPPCQGMSVANHKKNNEMPRNSLVVESIRLTREIQPKYFIFENVRAFLATACTNVDGTISTISDTIKYNLSEKYDITSKVVNFKDHGSQSSRTRTLVIGVRRDVQGLSPNELFPKTNAPKTLRHIIGDLPSLKNMGEISNDIFHSYREFDKRMLPWIETLDEGQSAFDNTDPKRIPHKVIDGEIVPNKNKNADKYARWYWDRVGPCVHTRNDTLSSQNTVHPSDNRVFSIREIMRMLTVPKSFKWQKESNESLNSLSHEDKRKFLKRNELNIRKCLGEAVPTEIFYQIASNIKKSEDVEKC